MPAHSAKLNASPLIPIKRSKKSEERRGWVRYSAELKGQVQPITSMETGNIWPVDAFDISAGGVSLIVSRRFEAGTLLGVSLGSGDIDSSYMPLARVCRVLSNGSHWVLGCSWVKSLDDADMQALLGPSQRWKPLDGQARQAA